MSKAPHINAERLKNDIEELSRIGRREDFGIDRVAFSAADMEARRWLAGKLTDDGFDSWMDGAGNQFGRYAPGGASGGAVLMGSHLDSVPGGGVLDGALGVVAGLEVMRSVKEAGGTIAAPIEVVGFADEEGRFGGIFGSRAVCGELSPDDIQSATDLAGVRLVDAMAEHGLDAMEALHARRNSESIAHYVEMHIEQGPVLDQQRIPIGVVDTITGLFKWSVRLIGAPDHAGTTPMHMRRDAFQGLAEFSGEINRILEEHGGENSKTTIGRIELTPGSANTVPGMVEFSMDVRDTDPAVLEDLGYAFRRALGAIARRRNLKFEFDVLSEVSPEDCATEISSAIEESAVDLDLPLMHMPSGAAHDCQIMARHFRSGMLFVPSKDGRSHSAAEWTHMDHIINGTDVLLGTVLRLAGNENAQEAAA